MCLDLFETTRNAFQSHQIANSTVPGKNKIKQIMIQESFTKTQEDLSSISLRGS